MRSYWKSVSVVVLAFATVAQAEQPLSAYQQKVYDEVKAGLASVEAGLADAKAKLAAGDVDGATGGYNTAVRNYNTHIRRIGQLPADSAKTTALRESAQALGRTIADTAAALKAGPTAKDPAAAPGNKPAANPGAKPAARLDYKQAEQLKNANYYLKEIEPRAARLKELTAGKLDAEAIAEANNLMKFVRQRLGYVADNLKDLPADHPDVAAVAQQSAQVQELTTATQAAIDKAAPDADKQMAVLGAQMKDDLAMVDSWSKVLGDPVALFDKRPDDAIATVGQLPQMRDAITAMLKRWNTRSTEKPNDNIAADMVRKLKYVDGQVTALEEYTKGLSRSLPEQINTELAAVQKLIQTAVSESRPAYFTPDGGVSQQLGFAAQKVKMLTAIDAASGATADKSLAAVREQARAAQKSLAQDIISANKLPAEKYTGTDKEDLRQLVIAAWKEAHPGDTIITVVFNTDGWSRTTRWDWSKISQVFSLVDYDYIQPKLFCKLNDTQAVEIPVDIYKDYQKDGRIAIKPWDKESDPPVTRIYLLTNLK